MSNFGKNVQECSVHVFYRGVCSTWCSTMDMYEYCDISVNFVKFANFTFSTTFQDDLDDQQMISHSV